MFVFRSAEVAQGNVRTEHDLVSPQKSNSSVSNLQHT